jgi:hypothetical protein
MTKKTQTSTISGSALRTAAMSIMLMVSLFAGTARAEIIGPDRRITWTPGVPGGIPNRTTVCATLSPSGGNDGAAIATAIKNCPAEGVVMLNAGTFTLSSGFNVNKNITVRGAGPNGTILNVTGPGNQKVSMGGGVFGASIAVISGYTRGSTSIIVAGDLLWLDQNNDSTTTTVTQMGTGGSCNWCGGLNIGSARGGARTLGQIIKVTGVSGNTLTLEKGLYWDYVAAAQPAVFKMTTVSRAGIEDLQVTQGTVTPIAGYVAAGEEPAAAPLAGTTYTTNMINADCTVVALFTQIPGSHSNTSSAAAGRRRSITVVVHQGRTGVRG